MIPRAFVAGLHLRWDGVRQRPHHLLSRIARCVPVVVVEEPQAAYEDRNLVRRDGPLTVIRPLRKRGWETPHVDARTLASVREIVGDGPSGVWLYTPMLGALAGAFDAAPLVYDVMDELAQFAFAPPGIAQAEHEMLARADLVFAGGRSLYAKRAALGPKVRCEPSGVELERFAVDAGPHPLPAALRRPIFGYVGVVDERLDLALIAALADAFPEAQVVLVGPLAKIDPLAIPRRANVHLTAAVPYDALPSWLAAFDVALMPFARNAATEFLSPAKTLEYFAAGVPVVSTAIADVAAEFGDAAYVADGTSAFIEAVRAALDPDPARIERGRRYAAARSWDAIAQRMLDAVASL
jgi:glycosyltransferase involved in cell wall biosynthesis